MTSTLHPNQALFNGQKSMPALAACEHFAGSEKLIRKAMQLQAEYGPIFDITCDCEDGARIGDELEHARMVARMINSDENRFDKLGVRIHDPSHPLWRQDVQEIVGAAGARLAYVTIPKSTSAGQAAEVIAHVQATASQAGLERAIPIHLLVETHGALEEVAAMAKLPHVEVLDFGQMDFVSDHAGAIPAAAMKSPQQFEHPLLVRAKTNLVAAALAHAVVPAHNVCVALTDEAVISGDARRAHVEFGFQRMWSIHPFQIRPIVEAMRPAAEELSIAGEILLAAQRADWGPIQYAGELHDRATYRYFWAVLRRAHATGMPLDERVQAPVLLKGRTCRRLDLPSPRRRGMPMSPRSCAPRSRRASTCQAACCPPSTSWPRCMASAGRPSARPCRRWKVAATYPARRGSVHGSNPRNRRVPSPMPSIPSKTSCA